MDKPASLILQWEKASGALWSALVETVADSLIRETGTGMFAYLPVKRYSLDDHQFIHISTKTKEGKPFQAWIPREIVRGIVESTIDLRAAFTFPGTKIK
jgi:hypothetical protein